MKMPDKKNIPCNLCGTINIGARPILKIDSHPIIKSKKCGLVYIDHEFTKEELESFYTSEDYPYLEKGIHIMERLRLYMQNVS